MSKLTNIPVIDIFAGPGGLGEGFSSTNKNRKNIFDIKLSIEKDKYAHETLELRSFFRKFKNGEVPSKYYEILKEPDLKTKRTLKQKLFRFFPEEYNTAQKEAWHAELGTKKYSFNKVNLRIEEVLKGNKNWVLIGGPPCQAYSLVGRSRVGGINEDDIRVYLYKEYLRIIAKHQPAVFVMENVKGLLSAKIKEQSVFDLIKKDLTNPSSVFKKSKSKNYRIYSLVKKPDAFTMEGFPMYKNNKSFVIESENYGVPQKRHRVILLGIREDIAQKPETLKHSEKKINLNAVIRDLPKIRSGLHRKYISSEIIDGKKKRYYDKVIDNDKNWLEITDSFKKEITSKNGFLNNSTEKKRTISLKGIGSEFVKCNTPYKKNPLYDWYNDPKLEGACNHISRGHLIQDLKRYMFASLFTKTNDRFPRLCDYEQHSKDLLPDHKSANTGKFADRFRVQLPNEPATTVTSHISKDGHYFIHFDPNQCRSLTVREAARIQTFPDNYLFCGPRTAQYHQVGNAVPPYLSKQIGEIVSNILKE